MRLAVQKLNNDGIKILKNKLDEDTVKYVKQYGNACNELYNLGYSPSPSSCETEDIFKAIFSMDSSLCSKFFNALSGEFTPSLMRIEFVLRDDSVSDESKEVLKLLYSALEAGQALSDFGELCNGVKFAKKANILLVKPRLTVSRSVYNSTKVPFDSPYVQDLIALEDGMIKVEFDYTHGLVKTALMKLGVSDSEFNSAMVEDKSLLLGDSFTFVDDCKFFSLLISGQVIGNGTYGRVLFDSIENYYKEYYETRTTKANCISYEEQNFLDATNYCISLVEEFRGLLPDNYLHHYVTSNKVMFQITGKKVDKPAVDNIYYIGNYVYDYANKCLLDPVNQLRGFSGEFVPADKLQDMGLVAFGRPVQMWSYVVNSNSSVSVNVEDYYALCCCKYIDDSDIPPLPDYVYNKKFEWLDEKEVCNKLGVSSLDKISKEIADVITIEYDNHTNEFRLFVGRLVRALICIRCDYTLKWRSSPNQIIIDSSMYWLDNNAFELALYEAKNIFEKLGF